MTPAAAHCGACGMRCLCVNGHTHPAAFGLCWCPVPGARGLGPVTGMQPSRSTPSTTCSPSGVCIPACYSHDQGGHAWLLVNPSSSLGRRDRAQDVHTQVGKGHLACGLACREKTSRERAEVEEGRVTWHWPLAAGGGRWQQLKPAGDQAKAKREGAHNPGTRESRVRHAPLGHVSASIGRMPSHITHLAVASASRRADSDRRLQVGSTSTRHLVEATVGYHGSSARLVTWKTHPGGLVGASAPAAGVRYWLGASQASHASRLQS